MIILGDDKGAVEAVFVFGPVQAGVGIQSPRVLDNGLLRNILLQQVLFHGFHFVAALVLTVAGD